MDIENKTEFGLFDAAFAEAVGDLPAADDGDTDTTPGKSGVTDGKEGGTDALAGSDPTPTADPSTDEAPDEGADSTEESKPGGDAITDDVVTQSHGDYQRQTVELLQELVKKGTSPGESSAASQAKSPDISQVQEGGTDPEPFKLSDEQTALLKTYEEEWPEVAKAVALRTQMAVSEAMGALVKQLRTELAPVVAYYAKTQGNDHFGAIKAAHEDFDTLKTQVKEWIATQPPGLRMAYQQIAKTGSAEDVVELFNIYKKANGIGVTPQQSSADARVTVVKAPAPEVQKAAASLTVVPGKRAVIPKGSVDADDFDAAWREAIAR